MPDITKEHNAVLTARRRYHKFIREYSEKKVRNSLTLLRRANTLEQDLIYEVNNLNKVKKGNKEVI